ncbi:MAG: acetate kinase [Bacteroidales bacterium]|jgi:acetate kinase|nr:acetate kinase [Bacteroidales bacterium]
MKILVLNCGSSSIKYQLIDMEQASYVLAKGIVERIGLEIGEFTHKPVSGSKYYVQIPIKDHEIGIKLVLEALLDNNHGVITSLDEIIAVGHRVAHGGEYFKHSMVLGDKELIEIRNLCELAPLHNPANLLGIEVMLKMLPKVKQIGVFDTSFHQTIPMEAFLYGIPFKYYEENKVRRYGFHGTSHKYVAPKAAKLLGRNYEDLKIIVCHLGNGASVCAIKNGKSVDTSMGFTPVEGLIMGTRCGDLDLGALLYIGEKEGMDFKAMNTFVNKKSGVAGITGGSSDMRDIEAGVEVGDERSIIALKCYCYRVKKYIGAYIAAMDGVDLIVMTGGIGENDKNVRAEILGNLKFFGVDFNPDANYVRGEDKLLTKPGSKTAAMVITTNEELVIATDTLELIK